MIKIWNNDQDLAMIKIWNNDRDLEQWSWSGDDQDLEQWVDKKVTNGNGVILVGQISLQLMTSIPIDSKLIINLRVEISKKCNIRKTMENSF